MRTAKTSTRHEDSQKSQTKGHGTQPKNPHDGHHGHGIAKTSMGMRTARNLTGMRIARNLNQRGMERSQKIQTDTMGMEQPRNPS
jgi:hypothetical protein